MRCTIPFAGENRTGTPVSSCAPSTGPDVRQLPFAETGASDARSANRSFRKPCRPAPRTRFGGRARPAAGFGPSALDGHTGPSTACVPPEGKCAGLRQSASRHKQSRTPFMSIRVSRSPVATRFLSPQEQGTVHEQASHHTRPASDPVGCSAKAAAPSSALTPPGGCAGVSNEPHLRRNGFRNGLVVIISFRIRPTPRGGAHHPSVDPACPIHGPVRRFRSRRPCPRRSFPQPPQHGSRALSRFRSVPLTLAGRTSDPAAAPPSGQEGGRDRRLDPSR